MAMDFSFNNILDKAPNRRFWQRTKVRVFPLSGTRLRFYARSGLACRKNPRKDRINMFGVIAKIKLILNFGMRKHSADFGV